MKAKNNSTISYQPYQFNIYCDHDFRFSHIEYPNQGTYSTIPPNKEVVVCRKCGEIRKFIQQ